MCFSRSGVGLSSSRRYGTIARTWKTVAHEFGHNCGGYHSFENGRGTTGGIMDYGEGLYNGMHTRRTENMIAKHL